MLLCCRPHGLMRKGQVCADVARLLGAHERNIQRTAARGHEVAAVCPREEEVQGQHTRMAPCGLPSGAKADGQQHSSGGG
jgi:hypothetical protein